MTKAPNVMIAEWLDIASIPDGWEILPLRRIVRLNTGATPSRNEQDFWAGSVSWLSSKDLKSIILVDSQEKISKRALAEAGLQLHPAGQLVCCFRSGILRHTFPVCMPTFEHAINQDLRALVQIFQCMPKYLQYYLIGMNNAILATCTKVGATVESIEAKWFLDFPFVLPPKPIQQAIVRFLDAKTAEIDGLVGKLERERKLLERYRRELIARTVTRGLNPDAPMRDSGIEWVGAGPASWTPVNAKAIFVRRAEFERGDDVHLTPSQMFGVLPQEEFIVVSGAKPTLKLSDSGKMKHVEPGDFIIHLRSFQGGLEYSEYRGKVSAAYTVITPRNDQLVDRGFFRWLFKSTTFVTSLASLTNQLRDGQSINFKTFSKTSYLIPPLAEQREIAAFLNRKTGEISSTVAGIDKQIELLGRYRKQVINDAVTGKIRVGEVA